MPVEPATTRNPTPLFISNGIGLIRFCWTSVEKSLATTANRIGIAIIIITVRIVSPPKILAFSLNLVKVHA